MIKFGLVGEKLGHTFSPQIHKYIFDFLKKDAFYNILEFKKEQINNITNELKNQEYLGVNVTIPYKTDLMGYMDYVSVEAKKIKAINTIKLINKIDENSSNNKELSVCFEGYNTDYYGFNYMLDYNNINLKNKNALILGTGGVSGAVYCSLFDNGVKNICFASTHPENAKIKYPEARIIKYNEINYMKNIDLIINCTPVGMNGFENKCLVNDNAIDNCEAVIDLIYNPLETVLLKKARKHFKNSINGLCMLVAQAVKSEEIWNDTIIDKSIIDDIMNSISHELKGAKIG